MNNPFHTTLDNRGQHGATLLVTLGILTVLSVMAVAFLITARLQRQTSASRQNRGVARNYMDEGLYQAVRQIENALTYPNYTDKTIPDKAYLTHQRLAPVGQWFARSYEQTNGLNRDIAYQALDVLASPTVSNSATINLFSPQVMRYVPSILTNGLQLSAKDLLPFRSGWLPTESLISNESLDAQLHSKKGRVAFLVFNCSGIIDANTFASGPTTKKLQRILFNQTNVFTWAESSDTQTLLTALKLPYDPLNSPFFHLSYDPDPEVYPLHYDCFETCGSLGYNRFGGSMILNLNIPKYYMAMKGLQEHATCLKFNLNAFTNNLNQPQQPDENSYPWFYGKAVDDNKSVDAWKEPVAALMDMMKAEESAGSLYRWPDSKAVAWNIANFMDTNRIPQISNIGSFESDLPTRSNLAVEDVPMINKVTVFSIFEPDQPGLMNRNAPKEVKDLGLDYYFDGINVSGLSNHYAVAVEVWYPFAPNPPPEFSSCYVGIYTNASDVITTTNRPWSQGDLRDWSDWQNGGDTNSVMRTLFYAWVRAYTNAVGPAIWRHPLWQTVTDQGDLWFTPAMTNHPSWPVADTNGLFSITNTPIWQAFYPDTYGIVTTNQYEEVVTNETATIISTNVIDVVTTNFFTYADATNSYVETIEPDGSTNRLSGRIGTWSPEPYPVLFWTNLTRSVSTTNVLGGIIDESGTPILFGAPPETNSVLAISATTNGVFLVISNSLSGVVTTNLATAFYQAPADTNALSFVLSTNAVFTSTEITPIPPLPLIPESELGDSLAALFSLLPTNSITDLYAFLLKTPDQFTDEDWRWLQDNFTQNPSIINRILPAHQIPTLGNLSWKDRHVLWLDNREDDDETVFLDPAHSQKLADSTFQGYFWTIYPKQAVSFMDVSIQEPVKGEEVFAVTNFMALGAIVNGKPNTIWVRPTITIDTNRTMKVTEDTALKDVIVDEALLTRPALQTATPAESVLGWTVVTNRCIADPRSNAYADDWRPFNEPWDTVVNTMTLNTEVHELPFIHFNTPFTSIGDLGHIYASYQGLSAPQGTAPTTSQRKFDTVTFSTRSGGALLDIFTLSPTNGPKRGLVQANTQQRPVVQTLLADVKVGWTNQYPEVTEPVRLHDLPESFELWPEVYADALTNAPYSMGWRSYADMLPSLSTNELISTKNMWKSATLHPMHDYTEDVLRGLVDKVSFRQNIFVIVVAAQALSPASTDERPIVLSDQRAAVTVIRDAYTGRWVIHSWVWLTE